MSDGHPGPGIRLAPVPRSEWKGRLRAALPLLLTLAACSGGGERLDASALRRLVLQPADLPAVFGRFDQGAQVRADAPEWALGNTERHGRLSGWKARYRRPGTPTTRGLLVVESRADVFDSEDGAGDELAAARAALPRAETLELGDEALVSTTAQGGVRFYTIVWRQANAVAAIRANGFDRSLGREAAVALARLQARRIDAELDR